MKSQFSESVFFRETGQLPYLPKKPIRIKPRQGPFDPDYHAAEKAYTEGKTWPARMWPRGWKPAHLF